MRAGPPRGSPSGFRPGVAGLIARADTFAAARRREPAAIDRLARIATDPQQPPLTRANAVGYLRSFADPRAERALVDAAAGDHPAVRATAVLGLGDPVFSQAVTPILIRALSDPSGVVRVGAALSLMNRKVTRLDGPSAPAFAQAKQDYLMRSVLLADDARVQLDTGKFHLLDQNAAAAAGAIEAAMRIDQSLAGARYFLAVARLAQGRKADAIALLGQIPATDPQAAAAAALLDALRR